MMPETNTPKKKKEKKPTTVGKIVAICTVFMMITVLLNSVILIKFYDSVKDDFLTYDEYSALNIKSTSDTINNMVSENKDNLSVSQIAEAVMPSVVAITSTSIIEQSMNPFFGFGSYQVQGAGSGIIVGKNDTELLIVTNNHVVDGTTSLTVSFTNDITIERAYVKGTSSDNDIAVVAIPLSDIDNDTLAYIKIATLGDSDSMKVGDGVVAIGNALGYGQSLTVGYVSAKDREITTEDATLNVIQTDAAINGGNSGGALLNMNGEVIGINVAKSSSSGSSATVEGMGYAIPISEAKEIIEKLSNKETRYPVAESERGYLGVKIITSDESSYEYYNIPQGAYIREFTEDSAASKAGLVVGDVIIAVEGDDVDTSEELIEIVSTYKAGENITVTVMSRDGNEYKKKDVEITLGAKSNES
jgi:serine protease Do